MTFKIKGLKCLPLPDYVTFTGELVDYDIDDLIYPLVGQDGYYYHRRSKIAWMEYNGIARTFDVDDFKNRFDYYDHIPLTKESRDAINVLIQNKICPKALKTCYVNDLHILELKAQKLRMHKLVKRNKIDA